MKKSILLSLVAVFVSGILLAQSDTAKLDRVQVVFPGKFKIEDMGQQKRCQLRLADSSALFQVVQVDLSAMGLDESTAIAMQAEPAFWEQSRDGLVAQMGADAKLIKDEMLDYKGTKVMQMQLERPAKEGGVNLLTLRMLIVGTYMIQYGHTDRNGKADVQLRDQFLASLQIN
ncbi:MAG: hypothetical protein ACK5G0_07365 [Bacteroidota bacterium]|jgi:hypothetical protein